MNQEKKIVLNHEEKKALNLEELKQINGGATMSIGKICKRCHRFVTTDPTIPDVLLIPLYRMSPNVIAAS